jgi:hypothetical protein
MAVLKRGINSSTQFSEHKESNKLLFYEPATVQPSSNKILWKKNHNPGPAYIIDINVFERFIRCNSILYHF